MRNPNRSSRNARCIGGCDNKEKEVDRLLDGHKRAGVSLQADCLHERAGVFHNIRH